jgi:hypothetical protein
MRYKTNRQARRALLMHIDPSDKNFCAVIALAQITDCSMSKAWHKLKELGRKSRKGTFICQSMQALNDMQYSCEYIYDVKGKTVNQFTKICDKNATYFLEVREHVLVIRGGIVRDWSEGKANRRKIIACWKCYKKLENK